tara:strand:+ start:281 stop:1177 length:897 start_codon:yes stop_codon:yes gene_type:complete
VSESRFRDDPVLVELLGRVQGLGFDARGVVEGLLSGRHRSPHHGVSVEFAEHKAYSPGDEIRNIDWKAFARSDRLQVKRFHHETDLTARIILDGSGSMAYGGDGATKYRAASIFALALSYLLLKQGDRVELMLASDRLLGRVPGAAGLGHFQAIAELLEQIEPEGETGLGHVLGDEVERIGRRKAVLVFTDGFEDLDGLFNPLRALVARQCSVTIVHVVHGDELAFPFEGVREFRSLEHPSRLVVEPQMIRGEYLKRLDAHFGSLAERARVCGIGLMRLRSDLPMEEPLFELLRAGLP